MSMLSWATIESRGTVGWSVNQRDPNRPSSSPVCQTNRIDRFGFTRSVAMRCAISSTETVPEPSSSAPLSIESARSVPGCAARQAASRLSTRACCSGVACFPPSSAPSGRTTWFQMRIESWSTGGRVRPMWSLCAPMATYSPRSLGSRPRTIATTFRAGALSLTIVTCHWMAPPTAPTFALSSGAPSRRPAAAVVTWSSVGTVRRSDGSTSVTLGCRRKPLNCGGIRSRPGIASPAASLKRATTAPTLTRAVGVRGSANSTSRPLAWSTGNESAWSIGPPNTACTPSSERDVPPPIRRGTKSSNTLSVAPPTVRVDVLSMVSFTSGTFWK